MVFHVFNALLFAAIVVGVLLHNRARLHFWWMIACFAADLLLLCFVQFTGDSAVGIAMERSMGTAEDADPGKRMWTMIHVGFSVTFLVVWVWTLVLGLKLLRKPEQPALRRRFRQLAWLFLACRLGNLLTAPIIMA